MELEVVSNSQVVQDGVTTTGQIQIFPQHNKQACLGCSLATHTNTLRKLLLIN